MSFLRLANVCKSFDGTHALAGVDLEIERGETVAVIGPSGCGKTTMLRCLALLDPIDGGAIWFDDHLLVSANPGERATLHVDDDLYRQRVGMVFQHLYVWPNRTVLGNLVLAPRIVHHRTQNSIKEQALSLLERMGMTAKAEAYARTLSGGQQQRLALARALMMKPDLLLLDEITSALDPEIVGDLLDIIAGLAKGGMTMILVTHEMHFAAEVADRIVFVDEGRVVEQGEPERVLSHPASERLQVFLKRVSRHRTPEVKS